MGSSFSSGLQSVAYARTVSDRDSSVDRPRGERMGDSLVSLNTTALCTYHGTYLGNFKKSEPRSRQG